MTYFPVSYALNLSPKQINRNSIGIPFNQSIQIGPIQLNRVVYLAMQLKHFQDVSHIFFISTIQKFDHLPTMSFCAPNFLLDRVIKSLQNFMFVRILFGFSYRGEIKTLLNYYSK